MTPDEWAEVFRAGTCARLSNYDSPALALTQVLDAMEDKCREIGRRPPTGSGPIRIVPPTIIEGGQPHGHP